MNRISIKNNKIYIAISFILAILFILPKNVLWAVDRESYFIYATSSYSILERNISKGIFSLLINEPLFLIINIFLSWILSPENIIRFIIFFSVFLSLLSLGKLTNYNYWIIILFIIMPNILKNYVIHLRQGLALSFYLIGFSSTNNKLIIFKYLSIFIHTSFLFLFMIELINRISKKFKINNDVRILFICVVLFIVPFFVEDIAYLLGDRRVLEYSFLGEKNIGFGFIAWSLFLLFFITIKNRKNDVNLIIIYNLVLYISSYFTLDFSARIFESIVPIIVVSCINDNRKDVRFIFISFFILYGLTLYYSGVFYSWIA